MVDPQIQSRKNGSSADENSTKHSDATKMMYFSWRSESHQYWEAGKLASWLFLNSQLFYRKNFVLMQGIFTRSYLHILQKKVT
ncbi:hypothetical protein JOD17_004014 [Geomicrobium sediminis]|uniref:Uncharacterized protein n=1 Tax=Geomicrobium sediminis TaxID=1347788 RepID=A0ABS2PI02_9BACL|nr:hypothetical protein [Geomicrobium sediminis]